jgi:hypothetical protein
MARNGPAERVEDVVDRTLRLLRDLLQDGAILANGAVEGVVTIGFVLLFAFRDMEDGVNAFPSIVPSCLLVPPRGGKRSRPTFNNMIPSSRNSELEIKRERGELKSMLFGAR